MKLPKGVWLVVLFYIVAMTLMFFVNRAEPTTIYSPLSDEPCPIEAVRPFLMGCKKCDKVRVRGTGNVSIDSEGNATEIVSERVKCRRCDVEFRVDLACQPPAFPQPQP